MSFDTMKVSDLRKVAESFGVEVEGEDIAKASKVQIIGALAEEGISYDMYEKFTEAEKPETEKQMKVEKQPKLTRENSILVRMDRANPSFSIGRYTFTQEHPFIAMSEKDAQYIFDTQDGFRPATPREAAEFYG